MKAGKSCSLYGFNDDGDVPVNRLRSTIRQSKALVDLFRLKKKK